MLWSGRRPKWLPMGVHHRTGKKMPLGVDVLRDSHGAPVVAVWGKPNQTSPIELPLAELSAYIAALREAGLEAYGDVDDQDTGRPL